MKSPFFVLLFAFLACTAGITVSFAAGAADAKARMRERVPAIDRLKIAEVVGENNRGFLEVRKPQPDAAAVVEAENKDRTEVFGDTAGRAGGTAEAVGRAFARQVAAASAAGVWLQHEDGSWYKK